MKCGAISAAFAYVVCIALIFATLSGTASAQAGTKQFASHDASIDGISLHYTMGGSGPAVLLLHGFAETSRMWNPILPALGAKFTVIAPDLPGIGDSSIPSGKIDMKTAAIQIHDQCVHWELRRHESSGTTLA